MGIYSSLCELDFLIFSQNLANGSQITISTTTLVYSREKIDSVTRSYVLHPSVKLFRAILVPKVLLKLCMTSHRHILTFRKNWIYFAKNVKFHPTLLLAFKFHSGYVRLANRMFV